MWLAIVLTAFLVLCLALAISVTDPVGAWINVHYRRRRLMVLGGYVALSVVIGLFGAYFALEVYENDRKEAAQKAAEEAAREVKRELEFSTTRDQLSDTTKALLANSRQLEAAQARADAIEQRRERQNRKFREAAAFLGNAMERGGELRYNIEDAINRNAQTTPDTFQAFITAFPESELRQGFNNWRHDTALGLDRLFPNQGLGRAFSEIHGNRTGRLDIDSVRQALACIEYLQGVLSNLGSHVERSID